MTGKHTPGPWVLTGTAGTAVGTTEQESAVAVCVCQGTRTVEEAQANARLIAAAPDLLEALKRILSADGCPANIIHEAIAKAEGRP